MKTINSSDDRAAFFANIKKQYGRRAWRMAHLIDELGPIDRDTLLHKAAFAHVFEYGLNVELYGDILDTMINDGKVKLINGALLLS